MSETVVLEGSITRKPGAFEKRIHEIDFIRGFLIALVLMDHIFCWIWQYNESWYMRALSNGHDVALYKNLANAFEYYWYSDARHIVRFFALFGFTFVSGISTAFSKNNWIRAGQMLAFAGVLAIGSNVFDAILSEPLGLDTMRIDFNIIAVLAWSTLFYCFLQKGSWRMIAVGVLITFLMSWFLYPHFLEYVELNSLKIYAPALIEPDKQADWLPLFPFIFIFFAGALLSSQIYLPERKSIFKKRFNWERPLCFMGRHSLIFYVCHQMVLIPFFLLLDTFLGK